MEFGCNNKNLFLIENYIIPELASFENILGNFKHPIIKNTALLNKFIYIDHYLNTYNEEESILKARPIIMKYIFN